MGSYDNSTLNILRNCQIIFQSVSITWHSHQQCVRVLFSPHPHPYSLLSGFFFILVILVVMKWYFTVVLIYISLMTNDIEHLFMYLLVIFILFLEKCLLIYFAHFSIGLSLYY